MTTDVLYVVGSSRSGSTILEQFLGQAANTTLVGESIWVCTLWGERPWLCTCGRSFESCPFWTAVMGTVTRELGGEDEVARCAAQLASVTSRLRVMFQLRHRQIRSRRFVEEYENARRLVEAFYRAILSSSPGSNLALDTSKVSGFAHLLACLEDLRVAFIHLIRDSRAVAWSWQRPKWDLRPGAEIRQLGPWTYETAVRSWNKHNASGYVLKCYSPSRVLALSYEEFVREPDATRARINQLLARLDMPLLGDRDPSSFGDRYHSIRGNPVRFDWRRPLVEDTRWRTEMPLRDRAKVTLASAPLLAAHHRLVRRRTHSRPSRA